MSETQLNSAEISLQPWVEDALVNLHARKNVPMNSNFTPWTIEEDRLLLHSYQSGAKITDIPVSSRSAEAIKLQLRRLQNVTPLVRDAPQEPLRPGGAVSVPAARHLDADRLDPRSTAVRADRLDSRRRKGASLTLFACTRAGSFGYLQRLVKPYPPKPASPPSFITQ